MTIDNRANGTRVKLKNRRITVFQKENGCFSIEFRCYHQDLQEITDSYCFRRTFFNRTYSVVGYCLPSEVFRIVSSLQLLRFYDDEMFSTIFSIIKMTGKDLPEHVNIYDAVSFSNTGKINLIKS